MANSRSLQLRRSVLLMAGFGVSHCPFQAESCNPASGCERGEVVFGTTVVRPTTTDTITLVVQRKAGTRRRLSLQVPSTRSLRLQAALLKQPGADREMVEILELALYQDEQGMQTAVKLSPEAGVTSKPHLMSVLYRLLHAEFVAHVPVTAQQALPLVTEPKADVQLCDGLRSRASDGNAVI